VSPSNRFQAKIIGTHRRVALARPGLSPGVISVWRRKPGEILIGYKNGPSDAFNAYGQKPWQSGYKDEDRERLESEMLERFKAEWAMKHGPKYTAFNMEFSGRVRDSSPEMMGHYKKIAGKYKRKGDKL
jgi:hypothetical protein